MAAHTGACWHEFDNYLCMLNNNGDNGQRRRVPQRHADGGWETSIYNKQSRGGHSPTYRITS